MNVRKRGLALLMCICMIFTLLPFSAFADGTSDDSVVYGTYDSNGNWTQDAAAGDTVTYTTDGDNTLSLTKTAQKKADNTYDITLKVVSTQTETTTKPGSAATVLVIDVSGSMNICATCNNSEQHKGGYEHSYNCTTGKHGRVQDNETRLKAAKDAAYDFILSYSGASKDEAGNVTGLIDGTNGLGRYVSLVSFSDNSNVACQWKDVSTVDGYNAVKQAIDSLSAGGGTNFEQGLSKAMSQLDNNTVKDIASKNVVALTDGKPTYCGTGKNSHGDGTKCTEVIYTSTKDAATKLKNNGAKLYTVCFGAANETITEFDDGNWNHGNITVGNFLKDKIATPATTDKTYAYNADNADALMAAFKAITSSITEGIKTGTVLDPMGEHITVTSKPENFVETANGYTWELGEPTSTVTENGKTTYTYELTYTVSFDPNFEGFDDEIYYAANGVTSFTPAGSTESYKFNVPGVKGTAPTYKVTYEYVGTVPENAPAVPTDANSYKAGTSVSVAAAPTLNGYNFSGWTCADVTVNEDGTFTMPKKDITFTGSWTVRSDLSYTVNYYLLGTKETVAESKTVNEKTFGDVVKETPISIEGYTPVSDAEVSLTIGINENVIDFYYYKNVTVTANDAAKTYGADDPVFSATVTGLRTGDTEDKLAYSITRDEGETVGEYAITPAGDKIQGYYKVTYVSGTLTITDSDTLFVTAKNYNGVYDGAEHGDAAAANIEGATIEYSTDNGANWTTEVPTVTNASDSTNVTVRAKLANYKDAETSYTLTVTPRTVTIKSGSASKSYDGTPITNHDVTYGGDGFVGDEGVTITFAGSLTNAGTAANGFTYEFNNGTLSENYSISTEFGELEITQRDLTITAGSKTGIAPVTCDEYTVEGLAAGDVVAYVKITGSQNEPGESANVASDAVIKNAAGVDVTKNYNIKYVDGIIKAIEPLNKEDHFNYIIGYTDGTVRPNADITRAEVATIFFRLLTDEAREMYSVTTSSFTDVANGAWYTRAIATLANAGILKGDPDGSFRPDDAITRAEMATVIARFAKLDVNTKTFSDIDGHWAKDYIELAAGNGWINGYDDGSFRPDNNITRAETVAMINRVLDRQTENVSDLLPADQMTTWSDNMDTTQWFYKDMQEATNNHECERVGSSVYEKWTEKLTDIDWATYQI